MIPQRWLLVMASLLLVSSVWAQSPRFGFRAGLNFANVLGDRELGADGAELESSQTGVRITAGAFAKIPFTKRLGLISEVAFTQRGHILRYDGPSYLYIPPVDENSAPSVFEGHNRQETLNRTLGYIDVPAMLYFELIDDKVLLEVGPSVSFLISGRAIGTLKYTDEDYPDDFLEYNLDYSYFQDEVGEALTNVGATGQIDGTTVTYPTSVGAYYFLDERPDERAAIRPLDFGLNFGLAYYLTKGLRFGARGYYGLSDITNDNYEFQRRSLDGNREYIAAPSADRNFTVQAYIAFSF